MRNEVFGNLGGHAEDDIEHAVGKTRFLEAPRQRNTGSRRLLRGLDDDGAARREGGGHLAHRRVSREIPRRKRRHGPNRLLQDHGRASSRSAQE